MGQILQDPLIKLVQNRLKQAEQALETNNLAEAQNSFEKALEVEGEHPDRVDQIRQSIVKHSDRIASQPNPDWHLARNTLNLLKTLALENDQTELSQQNLWLKQADFLLEKGNIDESFDIFSKLVNDEEKQQADQEGLKASILDIVRDNVARNAIQGEWDSLSNIIERVRAIWSTEDKLYDWLGTFSEVMINVAQATVQAQQRNKIIIILLVAVLIFLLAVGTGVSAILILSG
jgi:hypothetical protein